VAVSRAKPIKKQVKTKKLKSKQLMNEKDFDKVNLNFTLGQSEMEKGPVEPEVAEKGEDRVWGYNFGMRGSPIASETAFEPGFKRQSRAGAEPEGRGGRWKPDQKKKASKRAERKRVKAEEKQNKNKTNIPQPHPNESRPLSAFQQTKLTDDASMNPKGKEEMEPAGASADDDDEVMLVTAKKDGECQVRYLSTAAESKDAVEYTSRMKETFTMDATLGEVLQGKSKRKESVFREYGSKGKNERELEPYDFGDITPETHGEKRKATPTSPEESSSGRSTLKRSAKESGDKQESAPAAINPEKYTWGNTAWNPTPTWGTVYNYSKEYRDKQKQEAKEWSDSAIAAQRKRRDDAMSGGRSPPRKDARTKGKLLDDVDDPHGEMRRHECLQAVEERKAEKDDGGPTSLWGRPVLREGQSEWRAFQPWERQYMGEGHHHHARNGMRAPRAERRRIYTWIRTTFHRHHLTYRSRKASGS
jgi:hypothetical protein